MNFCHFDGKMLLMMILKVIKNQGSTLSVENRILEKPSSFKVKTMKHFNFDGVAKFITRLRS